MGVAGIGQQGVAKIGHVVEGHTLRVCVFNVGAVITC